MIEIKHLTARRGKETVLCDVSLKLPSGAVYGLYGAHGATISDLLAHLAGVTLPDEGEVRVNGFDTRREAKRAKKSIGYLPKTLALCESLTVSEQLRFAAEARGTSYERTLRQAEQMIRAVGLDDIADRVIGRLSYVERLCVAIAQTLVGSTDTVLLDDPTAGLSDADAAMIRGLIDELAESRTVILATSQARELYELCDRAILLLDGRVIEYETLDALLERAGVTDGTAEEAAIERLSQLLTSLCGEAEPEKTPQAATRARASNTARDGEYELIDEKEVR